VPAQPSAATSIGAPAAVARSKAPAHAQRGAAGAGASPAFGSPPATAKDRVPTTPTRHHSTTQHRSTIAAIAAVAQAVAKTASFPLALIAAVALFLLVQNMIDRRDPKLALAPVYRHPDLPFGPLPAA
jgi:hypothetical protein